METDGCYYQAWWLDDEVVVLGLYDREAKLVRIWQGSRPSDFKDGQARRVVRHSRPVDEEYSY